MADPTIYKDDNHKPEIAIAATDNVDALLGFLTPEKLRKNFEQNRLLCEVFNYREGEDITPDFVKRCVHKMFFEIDKDHE
jgi:mannose-6-phosphate isomerase class I